MKKPGDQVGRRGRVFQDEQVAAAMDDLEAGPGDAAGEYPGVDKWNDRVVVVGQYEGRVRKACPANAGSSNR
jgi:hypothetical protein